MNNQVDNKSGPEGIGGWLILIAITLVLSVIRLSYEFLDTFIPLWVNFEETSEYLSSITDNWYPLIMFETIGNSLLILFTLYVTWLFFSKNYKTPKMFIIWDIGGFLFILLDTLYAGQVFGESAFDKATVKELVRQFGHCLIWVPYFLVSVRVKNTFVKGKKQQKTDNLLVN